MKYRIINPYASVDWGTFGAYKANLHAHTTFSDGEMSLADVVEAYYALGYNILAIADHGIIGCGWTSVPRMVPVLSLLKRSSSRALLTPERAREMEAGEGRDGKPGMIHVKAIEMNACVLHKNHVNGFFGDYGQSKWGRENDFERPVAGMETAGGLSHLNHLGDWLRSGREIANAQSPKSIALFADIFKKYKSCVGMEIINRIDSVTKHDRVLWDGILQQVIPTGRNVFGFANDDSHVLTDIGLTCEIFMLPSNTADNVRAAMEKGCFFAAGRRSRYELGDDFCGEGDLPTVTRITVDSKEQSIAIEARDCELIEWVANGRVIERGEKINLAAHSEEITCYVRAQLRSGGGMCYTQPFIVESE